MKDQIVNGLNKRQRFQLKTIIILVVLGFLIAAFVFMYFVTAFGSSVFRGDDFRIEFPNGHVYDRDSVNETLSLHYSGVVSFVIDSKKHQLTIRRGDFETIIALEKDGKYLIDKTFRVLKVLDEGAK